MNDGVNFFDGPHAEVKKPAEDLVQEGRLEKREVVDSDETKDLEDDVFEEAISSGEDFLEQVQNPESIQTDCILDDSSLDVAAENSNAENGVENFEEPIGVLDEASKEFTEDAKVKTSVDGKSGNEVEELINVNGEGETQAMSGEINGRKEDYEVGANGDVEVLKGGDEVDVKSDKLIEKPEKADGKVENRNRHSYEENHFESPGEKESSGDAMVRDEEIKECKDDANNGYKESVDVSAGTLSEKQVESGGETYKNSAKMDKADEKEHITEHKDGVIIPSLVDALDVSEEISESMNHLDIEDRDKQDNDIRNASVEEASQVEDSVLTARTESSSAENKTINEQNKELQSSVNVLTRADHSAFQPSKTKVESHDNQNKTAEEIDKEHEQQASSQAHREHEVLENSQMNRGKEQQQNTVLKKEHEIDQSTKPRREFGPQPISNSASSSAESRNPTVTTPTPPAGLGRAAPLLEPVSRVSQQPRDSVSVSRTQTQQVEDSSNGETDEHDETREKLQMIRVKFLRLAHRLGQTPHNVVVAQVLYRLGLAEQLRGRNGSRVGAFSFDRASAMAEQLETSGHELLDFSCTIMVIGKTGVGKSATINSIFDEVKFSTDAFQLGTKKVQDVVGFVQGIKVRVIDTPGLLPSWSDQRQNEKILHSVKRFIKKSPPDIVLYLDRLDMQSRDFGDMPLLRTISDIFGPSIWFNAIVVLTHAATAPPEGPNGTASSYDMFVTQRSHVIQQAIRQAAGDMRLMNPVSLVENHSACRTNRAGQRVLPNGQVWKPHLLLLSFASKILAEANALLKLQDNNIPGRPFVARSKAPPLPFLLSSLLQSRPQVKLPDEQYDDEDDLEDDLEEESDSGEGSECDQLPPFRPLTKAQMAKLSRAQKKEYLDELEYREKLFMKKQLNEEKRRRKMMQKLAAVAKDLPGEYSENVEEETGGPASVPVPMPDLALPSSFDSDTPTHRYRCLDSSNQWLVRPVLETHGWDHDVGYEGVNVERLFVVKEKIPISFSGQATKDKKDASVQMELSSSIKHGEGKSTSLGFDMQNVGKDMAYTLRSETRFSNFRRNKAAAGLSLTLLGDSVSAGVKIEDKLIANKRFRLVLSGGAMTGRGDVAYGGSLEAQLRDKDYPLGRFLSTLGLSVMDWHGDLAIGGNIQSQLPIGRSTNLTARANLNNRGAGQVSIRLNSSEQLQVALIALLPLFKKLLNYPQQMQYGQ